MKNPIPDLNNPSPLVRVIRERRQKAAEATIIWPRLRDLPEAEREAFLEWLTGQTRPEIPSAPDHAQDGFYPWDYERWKAGLPVID